MTRQNGSVCHQFDYEKYLEKNFLFLFMCFGTPFWQSQFENGKSGSLIMRKLPKKHKKLGIKFYFFGFVAFGTVSFATARFRAVKLAVAQKMSKKKFQKKEGRKIHPSNIYLTIFSSIIKIIAIDKLDSQC